MRKARRAYMVTVDVDGVPGWNDRDRPEDMSDMIQGWMSERFPGYRPQVEYIGEAPDLPEVTA